LAVAIPIPGFHLVSLQGISILMRINISVALLLFCFQSSAQIVPSICTAPDSIVEKYTEDAYRLAMKKFFRNGSAFKDSVHIPYSHVDTVMRALLAVYNATALPARDTVVDMFDIHTFKNPYLNEVVISADSGLGWMQQLEAGIFPTGDSAIDSIISVYDLNLHQYFITNFAQDWVTFDTDSNYNTVALCSLFIPVPGVLGADPNGFWGDGNDITDSIFANDHVELIFSYGWGDCSSGCIFNRYWKFNVDTNCAVEYAGSYGNVLSQQVGIGILEKNKISVSPNPFQKQISINGITAPFNYTISTPTGNVLKKGICVNGVVDDLEFISPGYYFLRIQTETENFAFKIIKEAY
jgi:hypothetical protein